jgi:hypothetical protein
MVSGGLGSTDRGNPHVLGGRSRGFFERVGKRYGSVIAWRFEPHVAEEVFREWLDSSGVHVFLRSPLSAVTVENGRILGLHVDTGAVFSADVFIDCTYEGDLLAEGGVPYTWGREAQQQYGEPDAGRRRDFLMPISPYEDSGRLLPLLTPHDGLEMGAADRKVQAYTFRLCATQRPDDRVPFGKPPGYDAHQYSLLQRALQRRPDLRLRDLVAVVALPNGKADINNRFSISTDFVGRSWEYPTASPARRQEIWEEHKRYVQGYFYFLAHDPSVRPALRAEAAQWGLARSEFVDNDHWPHQLYIREGRRMLGAYVLTQHDLQDARCKPDSIGMGSYNFDVHHVQRFPVSDTRYAAEGCLRQPRPVEPYEIPYRALTPARDNCANLLVPVCLSASHVAFASVRTEPVFMVLGHSAGVAAALAAAQHVAVQDVDPARLQARLRAQGQILSLADASPPYADARRLAGVVVDNGAAQTFGTWRTSVHIGSFVGVNYLYHFGNGNSEKKIRYVPQLPEDGWYRVRISYPNYGAYNKTVPVRVGCADGERQVLLDQSRHGEDPLFHPLGVFPFTAGSDGYVEIGTEGCTGRVVADAVQWVPVPQPATK